MYDPMTPRPPEPAFQRAPRKGVGPVTLALLVVVLAASGWYFYAKRSSTGTPAESMPAVLTGATTATPAPGSNNAGHAKTVKKSATRIKTVATAPASSRPVALIGQPKLVYPPEAQRAHEQGTVMVMAQVDASGHVGDVQIVDRSGSRVLDRAALNEVRKWQFRPAMKDGRTVASSIKVPVDYKLDSQ